MPNQKKTHLSAEHVPLITSRQSFETDKLAQQKYGLSDELLMESAGALSAGEIYSYIKENKKQHSSVLILCGPGNNGGDGLVIARHLLSLGIAVKVFCSSSGNSTLLKRQKERLCSLGVPLPSLEDLGEITDQDIIVDALFGVGLNKDIEGFYAQLIQKMNSKNNLVVSVDTPSGLNVDTGQIQGVAVKADFTLSFFFAKPGFYLMQGPDHTGHLKVLSIGTPRSALDYTHFLVDTKWVSSQWPKRLPTDHKASQGHLLVLAGSEGFWGAGQLSALSAYRMGVGYVTWAIKEKNNIEKADNKFFSPFLNKNVPELLTQTLSDPDLLKNKTAVAIGPGFGVDKETKKILLELKKTKLSVVVDADAFTVCIKEKLFPLPEHWIVTPHSGELARFFNIKGEEIDKDRCSYAIKACQEMGCLVLLKGFHSVLAWKNKCWILPKGHSALAKAGTGDVLTGFIGALMARSLDTFSAGAVAGFVHGCLAEEWTDSGKDADSLIAQDLKEILPVVLRKIRSY